MFELAGRPGFARLKLPLTEVKPAIFGHAEFTDFIQTAARRFADWRTTTTPRLTEFGKDGHPKTLIESIAEDLLATFRQAPLLDVERGESIVLAGIHAATKLVARGPERRGGYYCNSAPVNAQKASKGQGDAVVHISAAALSSIVVTLPTLPEQAAIAAVLSDMDAELAALEARRDKTRDLKQAMMQELLTGKTRLVPTGGAHA